MKKFIAISILSLSLPLLAAASTVVGHSNVNLSSGLVGYWPMDGNTTNWATGTTKDMSGNGNTGSLINMSTSTTPTAGEVGGAFKFNGTNTYVTTPTQSIANAVTVSAWVYSSNFNQNGFIVGKSPVNTQWELFFEGSVLRWRGGAVDNTVFCSIPSNNHWHHVVGTQSGTIGTLYIDGVQCGSGTLTAIGNGGGAIEIGRHSGNSYYFKGTIDEARVYNRVLSASEVQQLYVSGGGVLAHSNITTLSTGLVGYWPLDGNKNNWATGQTIDLSGNGNTGSLISMSTTTSPIGGKIGGALNFNGTSYVDVPTSGSLNPGNTITVSAWIYPTSNAAYAPFAAKVDSSGITGWEIANSTGVLRATLRGSLLNVTAGALTLNKWQMGTFTYDGTTLNLYLNGTLVGSATGSATINSAVDLWIGKRTVNNNTFVGRIDDVRVYNRVLNPSEIQQLYSNGGGTLAHSNVATLASSLVGYWPMDGNTTNWATGITKDISGNGNNGALIGMSTSTSPVAGKVGSALKFSSNSTQEISLGTAPASLTFAYNQPFSISLWARPSATVASGVFDRLVSIAESSGRFEYFVMANNSAFSFNVGKNSTGDTSVTGSTFVIGQWYHLVGVYDGTTVTFYINGTKVGSAAYTFGALSSPDGVFSIGGAGATSNTFNGSIDEVRVYNRALTTAEIQQLYAASK